MSEYKTPGVYIEEQSVFPPSVSATATAVPAFLGYTTLAVAEPQKIASLMEFETLFGLPPASSGPVVTLGSRPGDAPVLDWSQTKQFHLYYYVEHYFRNGGGPCYVISVGVAGADYPTSADGYLLALQKLKRLDEPTLIVLSDALQTLEGTGSYGDRHGRYMDVVDAALQQSGALGDRFVIIDMPATTDLRTDADLFRAKIAHYPQYGAAYYPYLETTLSRRPIFKYQVSSWRDTNNNNPYSSFVSVRNRLPILSYTGAIRPNVEIAVSPQNTDLPVFEVQATPQLKTLRLKLKDAVAYTAQQLLDAFALLVDADGYSLTASTTTSGPANYDAASFVAPVLVQKNDDIDAAQMLRDYPAAYAKAAAAIARTPLILPPAAAMAGVYANVDRDRGVWKSPANVALSATNAPAQLLSLDDQAFLDVDANAGKSINCIVSFTGKGTLPWGARTLDAGNLDWRYISVRRLFIMVEESVKKASQFAVFEANDKTTWSKVRTMINNYLYSLWQKGALMGGKPEEAYFVKVGLGETMSAQDVLEGRMIVQVGLSAVRPAEFIILRFSQMQQTA